MTYKEAQRAAKAYAKAYDFALDGKLHSARRAADVEESIASTSDEILNYCEQCIIDLENAHGQLI